MNMAEEYFVGQPIPIDQLPRRTAKMPFKYPWLEIFNSIPEGYLQKVRMSYNQCRRMIQRLVKEGKVEPNEFRAVVRHAGKDEEEVFIIHYPKTEEDTRERKAT